METIILATNNKGKVKELKDILNGYEILSLKESGIEIEVIEDKDTFEGNAIKKASEISKLTGKICIADDSGLCIDALNGFPGVKTARFLGEDATQDQRNNYIIEKMKGIKKENRTAQSVTCIALVQPDGKQKTFTGILKGYISEARRGQNGFGYDDIFETEEGITLAEMDQEEKNKISNRRKALDKLLNELGGSL